jgi:hypothetical protein
MMMEVAGFQVNETMPFSLSKVFAIVAAREAMRLFRKKRIPCDVLILDFYWFGYPSDMGRLA